MDGCFPTALGRRSINDQTFPDSLKVNILIDQANKRGSQIGNHSQHPNVDQQERPTWNNRLCCHSVASVVDDNCPQRIKTFCINPCISFDTLEVAPLQEITKFSLYLCLNLMLCWRNDHNCLPRKILKLRCIVFISDWMLENEDF